jgi:hypothetical protein
MEQGSDQKLSENGQIKKHNLFILTACGRVSCLSHYATSRKVDGPNSEEVFGFFNSCNNSSRTMALGSTLLITELRTRNLPGGKERPANKTNNLTSICELDSL